MDSNLDFRTISGILADEQKFKVAAAVALGSGALDKIAVMTGLDNTVIMKALLKLEEAGLVFKKPSGYVFSFGALQGLNRELAKNIPKKPALTGLDRFFKDGKLITYPKNRYDQMMVLEHIIGLFEFNHAYPEKEVNEKLKQVHPDYASFRRYLIDNGLFNREQQTGDNGQTNTMYWRVKHL